MKNLKNSILFKIGIIFILIILLLIPSSMVEGLISEREWVQKSAINEVSEKWGQEQIITGPVLTIPYFKYIKEFSKEDSTTKIIKIKELLHILPENLTIKSDIHPEERKRGIYEVVVYNSTINLHGNFRPVDINEYDIDPNQVQYKNAYITLGITDLKGIEKQIELHWNKEKYDFRPGTGDKDVIETGINTLVSVADSDSTQNQFSIDLSLKGSQLIHFIPVGKTTDVIIQSNWNNPSFTGKFLPDDRKVNEKGFFGHWNILHLNRNFPQSWIGNINRLRENAFGVNLLLPVDSYQKSMRVAKYSILFISLTFLVFFFVEILNKVFIHPIQYILVGVALIVFYSLLLAFSEHMMYNIAYILSAILTLSLITMYVKAILKSNQLALLVLGILSILYTFIFTIIQLQDYALLIGSLGVFIILALVMYFSRKIDWYSIQIGKE